MDKLCPQTGGHLNGAVTHRYRLYWWSETSEKCLKDFCSKPNYFQQRKGQIFDLFTSNDYFKETHKIRICEFKACLCLLLDQCYTGVRLVLDLC